MYQTRYYVNFPSRVDGTVLCRYFKPRDEAEAFVKHFNLSCFYSVEVKCDLEGVAYFIDQEIYKCNHDENYTFLREKHYMNENKIYLNAE